VGTGTKPQLRGLANVTGQVAVAYTDASPTLQELVSKLWLCYQQLSDPSVGFGHSDESDYLIAMHPRRWAFMNAGVAPSAPELSPLPGRAVPTAGIRTTLGGGTEDEIFVLLATSNHVRADAPEVKVFPEVGSANLVVRVQAYQAVSSAFAPPRSSARLSGTGLVAPAL
jgi:hypothetical protein